MIPRPTLLKKLKDESLVTNTRSFSVKHFDFHVKKAYVGMRDSDDDFPG